MTCDRPSAPPSGDGAQILLTHVSFAILQLREQDEVARSMARGVGRVWEGRNVVFRKKFLCGDSPVSRDIFMVQDPIAGTPLLRAMSAHSVAEALQDCFFLCSLLTGCPLGTYS